MLCRHVLGVVTVWHVTKRPGEARRGRTNNWSWGGSPGLTRETGERYYRDLQQEAPGSGNTEQPPGTRGPEWNWHEENQIDETLLVKIRKDVHDGWNTNDVEVLTDFLQFHHICKYRQNFYSVKSHIFSGCRSCCIRNRRLGNCGRSKVYRTLRQGKSFNRIRWSSNERFRRRKSLAPRSTHQRWN